MEADDVLLDRREGERGDGEELLHPLYSPRQQQSRYSLLLSRSASPPQRDHLQRSWRPLLPLPPQFCPREQRSTLHRERQFRVFDLSSHGTVDAGTVSRVFQSQHPQLRIVSYNAWNTMPATWFITGKPRFEWYYKRMQLMARYIREADPDVAVLQEIRYDETLGDEHHRFQLQHLAELLPEYQYIFQVVRIAPLHRSRRTCTWSTTRVWRREWRSSPSSPSCIRTTSSSVATTRTTRTTTSASCCTPRSRSPRSAPSTSTGRICRCRGRLANARCWSSRTSSTGTA